LERGRKPQKEEVPLYNVFIASGLPSVSQVPACTCCCLSRLLPFVSQYPYMTIPRHIGLMPSSKWGKTTLPAERKRVYPPVDISIFQFLGEILSAPLAPLKMVKAIAEVVGDTINEDPKLQAMLKEKKLLTKVQKELKAPGKKKKKRKRK